MLVLMRKQGEQILIGDEIRVTVLSVEGNRVRLGLTAPRDVSILRVELDLPHDAVKEGAFDVEPLTTEKPPGNAVVAHS